MMTKREVFEKVKAHLLAQGERAFDYGIHMCAYRAPDGKKCAAGCLIADEHYTRSLEEQHASRPAVLAALRASGVPEEAMRLVGKLQDIHDDGPYNYKGTWAERLDKLEQEEFGHD